MAWYIWILLVIILVFLLRFSYHAVPTYFYLRKAKQGDAEAQFQLALRYSFGYGTTRDPAKSSFWMQKAAAQGHGKAKEFSNDIIGKMHRE